MNWDSTELSSLTIVDIKLLLKNRGATSKQCVNNKNALINLIKQQFNINALHSPLINYTIKSLKVELKLRKLELTGNKHELIQRLTNSINSNNRRKRNINEIMQPNEMNSSSQPSKRRRILESNINHNNSPSLDVEIIEANKSMICPLTHCKFQCPIKSSTCNHTFERNAIINYINNHHNHVECPIVGCSHFISIATLIVDQEMIQILKNESNNNKPNKPTVLDWTHLPDAEIAESDIDDNDNDNDAESDEEEEEESEEEESDEEDDYLQSLITETGIFAHGSEIQIERSHEYIDDFDSLYQTKNKIFGTIEGRSSVGHYKVSIFVGDNDDLCGKCSCPSWYYWCKHMIALGLTFVNNPNEFDFCNASEYNDSDSDEEDEEFSITEVMIERYTNDISYGRAMEYIGCFEECTKSNDCITGIVSGRSYNGSYNVSITMDHDGGLEGGCDCPSYHFWCKHIAALGLTFIQQPEEFGSE